ncbi:UNVERIFIED_ORG: methylenetetrahydrofolate reductase [NAD(P)H] [Clostridium botulinum]|uniref:methylenetetrahydrofolate reductase [NAD(P)H] n=1 Tax=Clostridium botulinum TaxID=1491 RepID=UPI000A16D07E|nr:methylenetetrahydrofolate reductase [NAD(P)H] [Clostridium botulinum]MBY6837014.1 methylenetetrahydrofolate reductase [NAD(P)H] [Clostridium botulinum]MBY6915523.1 methylenetetrahydrofolate reductase [NAD(P)H] [Clostridium botulinum]NFG65851.1 methylenetetrahydrofolate reductase [NAD(P)H] [Clostridium botulinum]NFH91060.1 methylenetetrahydrofolate reductase [NAD(P)H] [Clostridium botulinum]NFI18176.1 methylenetetrahydrofolate reductase [NAD(P)H] [Clostridium botulinum]
MNIKNLFKDKKVVFSFEIFPPKTTSSIQTIYDTLDDLKGLNPDYMSVTYGAGGSVKNNNTIELSSLIKNKYGIEPVSHLTCINLTKKDVEYYLREFEKNNIENILALRGDVPIGSKITGELNHANELIKYISDNGNFNIAAACYPEGHIEHKGLYREIESMKRKEEAGVSYFISQLFFDNNLYYNFQDEVRAANINLPIEAGIMPVTNKKQIERILSLSGASLPDKFKRIMERYEHNPEALRDAGIAYAVEQIVDLISTGVDGIHLYIMNNPYVAKRISQSIESILLTVNQI